MTAPQWAPVDDDTADLLTVLADPTPIPGSAEAEWDLYVSALRDVGISAWRHGDDDGTIDPNRLRGYIAGRIKAQRVGAFTHRALSQGLVAYTGRYVTSTDTKGRNSGKPARELRWLGTTPATVVGVDDSLALHGIDRPVVDAVRAL